MARDGSIAALSVEIAQLKAAFDQVVVQVGEETRSLGERACAEQQDRLAEAQSGVLEQADVQASRLRRIIAEYENLDSSIAVLEQLQSITGHLRTVVAGLDR